MQKHLPKHPLRQQKGTALFSVLILTLVAGAAVSSLVVSFTGQNKANRRSWQYEKSLMMAEAGVQRAITALAYDNDSLSWEMKDLTAVPAEPPEGFWLWAWQPVKDQNGKEVGRYRIEMMPDQPKNRIMRLKVYGMAYERTQNNQPVDGVQRVIGVELKQITLGDFAIATNHQLGGARINGGARIYGGILTGGELHMDASSTGIFNDYTDLQDNQNFTGYNIPSDPPDGEVFVYKDPNLPAGANNGVIKLASQATLGSNDKPMQGIHTAESSSLIDPGNGTSGTQGDGIIGNGEGNAKGPRDHKLPDIQFPDASHDSSFMKQRLAEAKANGDAVHTGDLVFGDTSFTIGSGPALSYDAAAGQITISGPVFVTGNLSALKPLTYSGKGGIFVDGNTHLSEGLEPLDPSQYPAQHAIGMVASGDMQLGRNSGASSKFAGFFFGNRSLNIQKAKIFGNVFGNTVNLPTTGTRPDIYVHPEVMAETGVTLPDFGRAEVVKNAWWEMSGSAAK